MNKKRKRIGKINLVKSSFWSVKRTGNVITMIANMLTVKPTIGTVLFGLYWWLNLLLILEISVKSTKIIMVNQKISFMLLEIKESKGIEIYSIIVKDRHYTRKLH